MCIAACGLGENIERGVEIDCLYNKLDDLTKL